MPDPTPTTPAAEAVDPEHLPTTGLFTIRRSFTGESWVVDSINAERVALFKRRPDAERFAAENAALRKEVNRG